MGGAPANQFGASQRPGVSPRRFELSLVLPTGRSRGKSGAACWKASLERAYCFEGAFGWASRLRRPSQPSHHSRHRPRREFATSSIPSATTPYFCLFLVTYCNSYSLESDFATIWCYSSVMNPRVAVPKLFRRKDRWYVRVQVPKAMQKRLRKREYWISLKTSDRQEAMMLAPSAVAEKRPFLRLGVLQDRLPSGLPISQELFNAVICKRMVR